MGWYPAREKDNTVSEANLYFPNKRGDNFPQPFTRIKRWGPIKENRGPGPITVAKDLARKAMMMGWLNGVRTRPNKEQRP